MTAQVLFTGATRYIRGRLLHRLAYGCNSSSILTTMAAPRFARPRCFDPAGCVGLAYSYLLAPIHHLALGLVSYYVE